MFDRAAILDGFDVVGRAAALNGTILDIAIYGGSALMLASTSHFATEDVDMAELRTPWPAWLTEAVRHVAQPTTGHRTG